MDGNIVVLAPTLVQPAETPLDRFCELRRQMLLAWADVVRGSPALSVVADEMTATEEAMMALCNWNMRQPPHRPEAA